MQEQKKEFTGVWIPKHIIEDNDLSMTDKIIYSEIACFEKCFKSNEKLGERYSLKKNTISIIVSKLIKKGYLYSNQKTGEYRQLTALKDKPDQRACVKIIKEPLSEKSKSLCDNNQTIDNNIDNNKKTSIAKTSFAVNPTKEFSYKEKIKTMLKDKNKHIQLIAFYLVYKGIVFENEEQYKAGIKRNLRPAMSLKGYELEKIKKTMYWLNGTEIDWTIETVGRYINSNLNKLTETGGVFYGGEPKELNNFNKKNYAN